MAGASIQVLTGRISFAVSFLVSLIFYFLIDLNLPYNLLGAMAFFIAIFLLSFFLFRYTLESVIKKRLSTIYDTIHQLKKGQTETKMFSKIDAAVNQAQEDVTDWYMDNKKEIDRLTILEKYRREFIGNVSHELKTPVFNIQGYLLTLLEGGLEDDTINRKYLERAEKSVEKLIKLLNELDMIIRLDTGSIELEMKPTDIVSVVKEVVDALDLKAEKKEISIKIDRKNMESLWVMADEDKVNQILSNLILNSIKYGKEKGNITVTFHDLNDKVLVEIKDNGIGIKKDELNRIFDRFYRTDTARSRHVKGSGLGLSIVKHLVEAHNETINVNSDEGEGSIFSFTLTKTKSR